MFSHDRIWAAIDALATRHSLSVSGLAKRAGLDPTTFNKSKRYAVDGRARWPSTKSLAKIMEATGASLDEFMTLVHGRAINAAGTAMRSIPLLGFAQAGAGGFFDDGGFPVGQGWDVVEFPIAPVMPFMRWKYPAIHAAAISRWRYDHRCTGCCGAAR